MPMRQDFRLAEAGQELIQIEKRTSSTVQEIAAIKDTAVALQARVSTNADGFFDAADLSEVNAVLVSLRAALQAATADL